MRIGIVGAGKVGCTLALGLKYTGYNISGVYNRTYKYSRFLSIMLGQPFDNDLVSTVKNSDIIFITVPDAAIESVSEDIAGRLGKTELEGKVFFHCSGALTSEALSAVGKQGAYTASLHPIQTFADRGQDWEALEYIYFGFEGMNEALPYAEGIVKAFQGNMLYIKKEDKPLYHSAACILSNYTVVLSYIAGNIFEKIGINADDGVKALIPLLKKTVENIESFGSIKALTGPISRGDSNVVRGHVEAFENKIPEIAGIYKELGKAAVQVALDKKSIDSNMADALLENLE